MVDVCGKKWKSHPAFVPYCCDIPKRKDASGAKHGAKIYPSIGFLISKHDIRNLRVKSPSISNKLDDVSKSYKYQFTVYVMLLDKGKQKGVRVKLDECVSKPNLYSIKMNGRVQSPVKLTNFERSDKRFSAFLLSIYTFSI